MLILYSKISEYGDGNHHRVYLTLKAHTPTKEQISFEKSTIISVLDLYFINRIIIILIIKYKIS